MPEPTTATPAVTVIIPVYNGERYLAEAIESVLSQTFGDFELVVVDDGSTDGSQDVALSFFDSRIRYHRQDNGGLSNARNTGIRCAQGELIGMLDSDDRWHPNFLQTLVSSLRTDPDAVAAYCGWRYINRDGLPLPEIVSMVVPAERLYARLLTGNFILSISVLVRKKAYIQVGSFDERLKAVEDYDMWLRLSRQHKFIGVHDVLAMYRMSGSNMSDDLSRMYKGMSAVMLKHFGIDDGGHEAWTSDKRMAYSTLYQLATVGYLRQGNPERSAEYLRKAINLNPELAKSIDLCHGLAAAHRPRERMGDVTAIDLGRAETDLLTVVNTAFPYLPGIKTDYRLQNTVHGAANFALGQLNLWRGQRRTAGHFVRKAVLYDPALMRKLTFWRTALNCLPGASKLRRIRDLARR